MEVKMNRQTLFAIVCSVSVVTSSGVAFAQQAASPESGDGWRASGTRKKAQQAAPVLAAPIQPNSTANSAAPNIISESAPRIDQAVRTASADAGEVTTTAG